MHYILYHVILLDYHNKNVQFYGKTVLIFAIVQFNLVLI